MTRREQAIYSICSGERNCACWDYVVRRNARGRFAQYTPGTDSFYYENGREVGCNWNIIIVLSVLYAIIPTMWR